MYCCFCISFNILTIFAIVSSYFTYSVFADALLIFFFRFAVAVLSVFMLAKIISSCCLSNISKGKAWMCSMILSLCKFLLVCILLLSFKFWFFFTFSAYLFIYTVNVLYNMRLFLNTRFSFCYNLKIYIVSNEKVYENYFVFNAYSKCFISYIR